MSLRSIRRFRRLLTDRVQIYREPAPDSVRDSLGHVRSLPAPIMDAPTRKNARPAQNWSGDVADAGPGEQQNAKRTWLLDRDLSDVLERDVLLVTAGPHEGMKLRVGSVELAQDSRRVHHVEVGVDVWHGELEEAS